MVNSMTNLKTGNHTLEQNLDLGYGSLQQIYIEKATSPAERARKSIAN